MDIKGIGPGIGLGPAASLKTAEKTEGGGGFKGTLVKAISDVESLRGEADQAVSDLTSGKGENIHKAMIALEKADISFQLFLQVRNKAVSAYEEVMRMSV